jgi:hypothetical protein
VGQAHPRPPPGLLHHQQPGALGGLDGGAVGQALEHGQRQRLTAGGQLDRGALGRPQPVQAGADQLGKAGGAAQATRPAPQLAAAVQGARLQPPEDELAQEQRVAFGHADELVPCHRVDLAVQGAVEQPVHRLAAQRRHGHPPGQAVLPQRDDRVGGGLAAAHGGHDRRQRAGHELVDERGRGVVEQVRVVDPEQQRPPTRPLGEQLGGPAEGVEAIVAEALGRGQQVGDGPERDRSGRPGCRQPLDPPPRRLGPGQGFPGHPRLADPGLTDEHHTAGTGVRKDSGQHLELGLAPHQRPRDVHPGLLYRSDRPTGQ